MTHVLFSLFCSKRHRVYLRMITWSIESNLFNIGSWWCQWTRKEVRDKDEQKTWWMRRWKGAKERETFERSLNPVTHLAPTSPTLAMISFLLLTSFQEPFFFRTIKEGLCRTTTASFVTETKKHHVTDLFFSLPFAAACRALWIIFEVTLWLFEYIFTWGSLPKLIGSRPRFNSKNTAGTEWGRRGKEVMMHLLFCFLCSSSRTFLNFFVHLRSETYFYFKKVKSLLKHIIDGNSVDDSAFCTLHHFCVRYLLLLPSLERVACTTKTICMITCQPRGSVSGCCMDDVLITCPWTLGWELSVERTICCWQRVSGWNSDWWRMTCTRLLD